jgi:ankyrin repeat protein
LAVSKNSFKACKHLIEKGGDVNKKNDKGETALHLAVRSGFHLISAYLVEHKADVNLQNKRRETPLHCAILKGDDKVCEHLIEHGANVNEELFGTPMHVAAASNQVNVLRYFVQKRRGNVNATRKRDNWSPLHCAAFGGKLDALKYLIEHGAYTQARDKYGKIPAQIASDEKVIAYFNSSATGPRARRSVDTYSVTFPIPFRYIGQEIADCKGRFWSVDDSSDEGSPVYLGASFASELQNFFNLFRSMIRYMPPLYGPRVVFQTIKQTLQDRMDSVAESAIEVLPEFENVNFT